MPPDGELALALLRVLSQLVTPSLGRGADGRHVLLDLRLGLRSCGCRVIFCLLHPGREPGQVIGQCHVDPPSGVAGPATDVTSRAAHGDRGSGPPVRKPLLDRRLLQRTTDPSRGSRAPTARVHGRPSVDVGLPATQTRGCQCGAVRCLQAIPVGEAPRGDGWCQRGAVRDVAPRQASGHRVGRGVVGDHHGDDCRLRRLQPETLGGRVIAIVVMVVGIGLVAIVTACGRRAFRARPRGGQPSEPRYASASTRCCGGSTRRGGANRPRRTFGAGVERRSARVKATNQRRREHRHLAA